MIIKRFCIFPCVNNPTPPPPHPPIAIIMQDWEVAKKMRALEAIDKTAMSEPYQLLHNKNTTIAGNKLEIKIKLFLALFHYVRGKLGFRMLKYNWLLIYWELGGGGGVF